MSDEANVGLVDNEPADATLDSILDSAIAGAEDKAAAEPNEIETSSSDGRARDEKGRFVPKESAAEASDKEPAQAAKTDAQPTVADPAQVQPVEPPARWTPEDKAKFATWPPEVQQAVSDRYKAMEADHTRKTQEAAEIRRTAEPFLNALKPFEQYLQQLGPITGRQPHDMIAGLLATEYRLRTGSPQEKYQALAEIVHSYGLDLAAFTSGQVPQPDPEIHNLRQELAELKQWRTGYETQVQQQEILKANYEIDTFSTAKDEHNRLLHPHFERVKPIVAHLLATEECRTLKQAYDKACEPINAAIAEELKNRQQVAETQRKEAVAKAEKAAPVRSSGSQPGGSAKSKDLDSILSDAIAKHA